jgi:hypothetical protein
VDDTFSNSAAIYFDFNAPVITNEAVTTIALLDSPDFVFEDNLTLYPNPTSGQINIEAKNGIILRSAEVYNVLGQMVISGVNIAQNASFDVSRLGAGTYMVKVSTDEGSSYGKFIKE